MARTPLAYVHIGSALCLCIISWRGAYAQQVVRLPWPLPKVATTFSAILHDGMKKVRAHQAVESLQLPCTY